MITPEVAVQAAALIVATIGAAVIWFQLKQSSNSAKATLLISINRDLNQYSDIAARIDEGGAQNWANELGSLERERLLDYISYFEGLFLAYQRGLFTITEVDEYFSGRFFRLTSNLSIQQHILLNEQKHGEIFRPIIKLHAALKRHRKEKALTSLEGSTPLDTYNAQLYRKMAAS